jgi:adenylate cyclase
MIQTALELGAQMAARDDRWLLALYRRQQERAWIADLVEHIEAAVEETGTGQRVAQPPAICFLDLVGYTRLTEEQGDEAAAEIAATLAELTHRAARARGGRPVKWLGDGVMFFFKRPRQAVRSALEMVQQAPAAGLPPAHVGVHAGPIMVQDGDYFGRTVNLAARIAGQADAGQVLVTDEVVAAADSDGARFKALGPVPLKGFTDRSGSTWPYRPDTATGRRRMRRDGARTCSFPACCRRSHARSRSRGAGLARRRRPDGRTRLW